MEKRLINNTKLAIDDLIKLTMLGGEKLHIDYDKKADVLYVNFDKPQKADDSKVDVDGIIKRTRNNKLIGLTILNASQFS